MEFVNRIKEFCKEHKKVGLFVDMDGTVVEYNIFPEGFISSESKGLFINNKPLNPVINVLKELSKIKNLDIYMLTLSRSKIIKEEKKIWLKKYMPFVKEDNYIILVRDNGDYNIENRSHIKADKMLEKSNEYDYLILLDDEHTILRTAKKELKNKGDAFHVSSALI